MDFTHVKVGDYVWIGRGSVRRLELVTKLTDRTIVISATERYYKADGYRYGPYSGHISGVAGEDEVAAWKAQQEAKRREREEMEVRQHLKERRRQELCSLFPDVIWLNNSDNDGHYDVCGLTEEQVRLCADILKATEATSVLP